MYYYKINYIAGSLLTLVITLLLGSLIFIKGRGGNIVKSYFLLMLSIAAFSLGMLLSSMFNDSKHALLLTRFSHAGVSFIPVFYFHFIVKLMRLEDKQRQAAVIGYILAACFSLLNLTPYLVKGISFKLGMNLAEPGIFYMFFIIFFITYPAYAHYLIYRSFSKLSDIGKRQIRYVTIAGMSGLSGGSLIFFSVYGVNIPFLGPMALYFVAASNLFVAIATYTVRLMGFEIIKRRTLIFSTLYGVIVGGFVACIFILQNFLSVNFNLNRWALPVAALFILTIFIRPLEQFLAKATDTFLYQRGYDYMLALKSIAKGMTLIGDTKKLLKLMVRFMSREIRVTGCAIYIFNKTANAYLREVYRGFTSQSILNRMDAESPFVKWLIEKKEPVSYESIVGWIQGERVFPQRLMLKRTLDQIRVAMEKMGAVLCIPSFLRGEMIGFIALGSKLSGNIYTKDDFSFLVTLANSAAIAFENARMHEELNERIKRLETLYKEEHTLFLDAASAFSYAIDAKNGYAHAHALKSSAYAIATTKELEKLLPYVNFNESFYETLRIASLLHDVGKIGIPDSILKKQSRLTLAEEEKLKEHVIIGQRILKPIREIEDSFDIIRHHHENFDGTGYPDGLKGNEIPMASRIIAVCNAYDSMVNGRYHKKPVTKEAALKELEDKKGSQFDPVVVDAFIRGLADPKNKVILSRPVV
jgi:HD-GYP domain-containing protein (c-di-GMP phosphodiesterase class II)